MRPVCVNGIVHGTQGRLAGDQSPGIVGSSPILSANNSRLPLCGGLFLWNARMARASGRSGFLSEPLRPVDRPQLRALSHIPGSRTPPLAAARRLPRRGRCVKPKPGPNETRASKPSSVFPPSQLRQPEHLPLFAPVHGQRRHRQQPPHAQPNRLLTPGDAVHDVRCQEGQVHGPRHIAPVLALLLCQ